MAIKEARERGIGVGARNLSRLLLSCGFSSSLSLALVLSLTPRARSSTTATPSSSSSSSLDAAAAAAVAAVVLASTTHIVVIMAGAFENAKRSLPNIRDTEQESKFGSIYSVSGPGMHGARLLVVE